MLLAGETLRYTITVKNIGTDNAVDVALRDQIPANTTYVAGSTTLNGTAVADDRRHRRRWSTASRLRAGKYDARRDARGCIGTTSNVATLTFEVSVDPVVADGTVISNQGVRQRGRTSASWISRPTTRARRSSNDPTRDVVGNSAAALCRQSAVLQVDQRFARHRRSGRLAALHDHGLQHRRDRRRRASR